MKLSRQTFFALLASAIQAPDCPVGWMLSYQTSQLRSVVLKLLRGEQIYSKLKGAIWSMFQALSRFPLACLPAEDSRSKDTEQRGTKNMVIHNVALQTIEKRKDVYQ